MKINYEKHVQQNKSLSTMGLEEKKVDVTPKRTALAQTMTNGELYRYAWAAVREAIENTEKWETPDEVEIARLKAREKELKGLMEESFLAGL